MNEYELPPNAVVLNPYHAYNRVPPALVGCWCGNADLHAYFYNVIREREAHCPPEYMVPFEAAHIVGGKYVLVGRETWLAPSVVDHGQAEALRPAIVQRIAAGEVRRLTPESRPTVMIAKAGADNYGHVLAEILPRIINLSRSPLRTVRLLLPDGMRRLAPTLSGLLGRLGITADLMFVPDDEITAVENLVFIGPVSRHNTRKSATLLAFRDLVWRSLDLTPMPRRRLYIERPAHEQRSLSNAAEVRALLEAAGYETVHPAALPFDGQVRLFSQASHIIGTLGAGLTNILFAPAACRVTMIDPGLADYFFWDLAALAGQPFTWMFTGPVSFYSPELEAASYSVDLDGLRYALRLAA